MATPTGSASPLLLQTDGQQARAGLPWSPGVLLAYDAAYAAYEQPLAVPLGASRTIRGSLDAGLVLYFESANFLQGLAKSTQGLSAACWSAGARITAVCRCGHFGRSTFKPHLEGGIAIGPAQHAARDSPLHQVRKRGGPDRRRSGRHGDPGQDGQDRR